MIYSCVSTCPGNHLKNTQTIALETSVTKSTLWQHLQHKPTWTEMLLQAYNYSVMDQEMSVVLLHLW